ncbi:MAG: DUF2628 domain-containing protein [Pseudomonadota bacterium]
MKPYQLFWNHKTAEPLTVKSGFSLWAFIFTFIYPAYKGHYLVALMYFCGNIAISALSTMLAGADPIFSMVLNMIYSAFVGFDYADAVQASLHKNKKISYIDTVFAANEDHAEFLAFQKHVSSLNNRHVENSPY